VREIITCGENGLLAPMGDADILADRLIQLLQDPRYAQKLAEAGYQQVCRKFTIERTARQVEGVYGSLLGGPRR
jgi:glycosyltransferase involved in cell wall biosynthesis